ncbi:MAG TPA: EAL domain-containing protein [Burkholderiales bacterium]|nr:EAL domain-containing protein [Burkholderiales bacterium]
MTAIRGVTHDDFRSVFEHAGVGMAFTGLDDQYVRVNRKFTDMLGYTSEELCRLGPAQVAGAGHRSDWLSRKDALLSGASPEVTSEKLYMRKDGSAVWVSVVTSLIRADDGQPQYFISVMEDISARRAAEVALRESEEKFRQLADNIPEIFWITDARQRELHYLSPGFETLTGMRLPAVMDRPRSWLRVVHVDDRERVRLARKGLPHAEYDIEYRIVRADGGVRWVHDQAFPVRDASGNVHRIAGIGADITERKEAEEKLVYLAHYDGLTGLPNRLLFFDRLGQTLAQARRHKVLTAVMFLDLDRFKIVNDTLGHAVGDELLCQVAGRLTACTRQGDTVARFSGDEFVLIVNDLHEAEDARLVAQKVLLAFVEPFRLGNQEVFVSTSIGISMYPSDCEDEQALLKNADTAMYRAKESGRNNFQFYTPQMNARALYRLNLENALRRALERGEFRLHYQPKTCLNTGQVTGLEALLRWERPDHGLVPPADFVPLLEDTGLIVQVGEWVLREACRQIAAWQAAGRDPIAIAINISARQFADRNLGEVIKRVLDEYGADPRYIELELTESLLMVNTEEAVRALEYLKSLGLRLSIDDFGTGYSSLSYLKRFPIDALKIDRSFIDQITTDVDDATITRAVIGMAHNLGLKVVAEGVETQEQLSFLSANGCDEAQGYFFARPQPALEVGKWLTRADIRLKPALASA